MIVKEPEGMLASGFKVQGLRVQRVEMQASSASTKACIFVGAYQN